MPSRPRTKNVITIKHIDVACRHVDEMRAVGISESLSIRILEILVEHYATIYHDEYSVPYKHENIKLWSSEANKLRACSPLKIIRSRLIVKHGTPKRVLARCVLKAYRNGLLSKIFCDSLVMKHWAIAVVTREEDLNIPPSTMLETPMERWLSAGIRFD